MRKIATKQARLEYQNIEFNSLIKSGYKKEEYKELNIFTKTDAVSTWLKVFKGTSTKPTVFKRYRTELQCQEAINNVKKSLDRILAYKQELKENPKKSSHANCAKAIREELKKCFPDVKFSVRSQDFANGDSVNINWTNGPTEEQINSIVKKYAYGRFDSMQDLSYSVFNDNLPQAKYVQSSREITEDINKVVFDALKEILSDCSDYEINRYKYQIINKTPIPVGATVTGLKEIKENGTFEDCYTLKMLLPEKETKQFIEKQNFEAVEVKNGEIQVIEYSEKSIALIGDTKPIKDKLKELGGKFNFRLSCGAGWIFPKTKLSEIEKLFA